MAGLLCSRFGEIQPANWGESGNFWNVERRYSSFHVARSIQPVVHSVYLFYVFLFDPLKNGEGKKSPFESYSVKKYG